jgi:hypothetical protein
VSGRLIWSEGVPALTRLTLDGNGQQFKALLFSDGAFVLRNIAPGRYTVSISDDGSGSILVAPALVEVKDRDVRVELSARRVTSLERKFVVESADTFRRQYLSNNDSNPEESVFDAPWPLLRERGASAVTRQPLDGASQQAEALRVSDGFRLDPSAPRDREMLRNLYNFSCW